MPNHFPNLLNTYISLLITCNGVVQVYDPSHVGIVHCTDILQKIKPQLRISKTKKTQNEICKSFCIKSTGIPTDSLDHLFRRHLVFENFAAV